MTQQLKQANFMLPLQLFKEIQKYLAKDEINDIVIDAFDKELKRRKFKSALNSAFGIWKDRKDIKSTRSYVRSLRKERKFDWGR